MAGISRKTIEKSLIQKGFRFESGDHRYYVFYHGGKRTSIRTWVSHGSRGHKECGDDIISAMRRQLKLDTMSLARALLECPMDGQVYIGILKEKEILH